MGGDEYIVFLKNIFGLCLVEDRKVEFFLF